MVSSRMYDLMYRWWAPWDGVGVRDDLVRLLDRGDVTPETHPRAIDLGCGTGANVVYLAERGFKPTGIDFSPVALGKARRRAEGAGMGERCSFAEVDLTESALPGVEGQFDLLVDFGTLDDLPQRLRPVVAAHVAGLAAPGSVYLLWCFYGDPDELPLISFNGPSRMAAGLGRGEERELFGSTFDIEEFSTGRHTACFLLRRRP